MSLQSVYNVLQETGSRLLTLDKNLSSSLSWIKKSAEFLNSHPWTTLGVTTGALVTWKAMTHPRDLPPGPWNIPILGAVSFMTSNMEEDLLKARPKYGDIIYFKLFGNDIVVLNSETVIREALVKRGDDFVHRRISPFVSYTGLKEEIFIAPYNEQWRANKKFALTALKTFGFGTAKSEGKMHRCLQKLEDMIVQQKGQPIDIGLELKTFAAAIIHLIYFNEDLKWNDTQLTKMVKSSSEYYEAFSRCEYYSFLHFAKYPRLQKIFLKKYLDKGVRICNESINDFLGIIQKKKTSFDPDQIEDVIDYYLAHRGDDPEIEKIIASNIFITLPDAIDTTSLVASWAIFYLTHHQDVLRKLQEEIDQVIGKESYPSISDKGKLPYAEAVMLETLRCSDTVPLNIPRDVKEDVEFGGYRIPKGAMVWCCFHSVHYDPEIFPEPAKFDPSRFLDEDGMIDIKKSQSVIIFGLGRRMCFGEQFARVHLFLTIVRLAQRFNFQFDPNQPQPSLTPDSTTHSFKYPTPYKVCLQPRSK